MLIGNIRLEWLDPITHFTRLWATLLSSPISNEEEAKAEISFLQAGFTVKLMTFATYPSIGSEYNDKIETEQS